jgi:hypothetical protein
MWILVAFASYGIIAGLVQVIYNEFRPLDELLRALSSYMNIPTILTMLWLLGENFSIPVPTPVWEVIVVMWSSAVWTAIGFACFHFYKWLKYIPP